MLLRYTPVTFVSKDTLRGYQGPCQAVGGKSLYVKMLTYKGLARVARAVMLSINWSLRSQPFDLIARV